jgi:anti-sigma factor RsiW
MTTLVTDEMLMAFADGELAPAEEGRVRAALAADPDLAVRVAMFRETRRLAQTAFGAVVHEPVPEALVRAVVPAAGQARTARVGRAAAGLRLWRPALAASLALAAGLAGYGLGTRREPPSSPFAALGRSEAILAAALTEDSDGGRRAFDGGGVEVGSTFRLEGGRT